MKKVIICVMLLAGSLMVSAWGFFAHRKINRLAVFTLPAPLFGFYKANIDYITDHAPDADKRRYADPHEACRHYLDADHYEHVAPLDTLPPRWKDAVARYTEDTLNAYGIVPWYINLMMIRLTTAFKEHNRYRVLKLSADIGHYIADAHVPLHATENYNGQLTNQVGIHAFWESRLPELFSEEYDLFTGRAGYISNVQQAVWQAVNGSFAAKDSVLRLEKELSQRFPDDQRYAFEQRGNLTVRVYSKEYSRAYSNAMGDMVERRMRESIALVGSLWYTAWVDAGQPDLDKLTDTAPGVAETDSTAVQEKKFNEGKIIGRPEE